MLCPWNTARNHSTEIEFVLEKGQKVLSLKTFDILGHNIFNNVLNI